MDEKTEKEYEEVREKKEFSKLITNLATWQFISILILIILFGYLLKTKSDKYQLFIIGFAIIMIFLYSQKKSPKGLIDKSLAKKIAVLGLEEEKEDYYISPDVSFTPKFCYLQYHNGEPFKWHVGVKIEDNSGYIDNWRVIIHPYEGIITGIVRELTEFEGNE